MPEKLKDLLSQFSENCQRLVSYELLAYTTRDALKILQLCPEYADNLRSANPSFREMENYILSRKESFVEEARKLRREWVKSDGLYFLDSLLKRAKEKPESLSATDRRLVIAGLDSLRKMNRHETALEESAYSEFSDETILARAGQKNS